VTSSLTTDVLIVGAGLAGLFAALRLAPRRCVVLSPTILGQAAASAWAQGGLAAALDPADSPEQHAADTVAAGAGLVDPEIALLIAREAPAAVEALVRIGVPFDRTATDQFALSLEAAHSQPRVARVAGDLAGRAIMETLVAAVRRAPHITVLEGVRAVALTESDGRVTGVMTRSAAGDAVISAAETVMATGGAGGLYRVTTNPKEARGAALAQAYGVGAVIADPEFVQFHPTALDVAADPAPLATESLRGEGSRLVNADGTAFMHRYHVQAELAPRDVVARAIHAERVAGRGAFLDCRNSVGQYFPARFPTVFNACQQAGVDPRTQLIPVAPAAHYHMGGIATDVWGRSTVPGLSACGECASTGAHGANRLASNSLLEAVVFAQRIAERLRDASLRLSAAVPVKAPPLLAADMLLPLRERMSRDCGVIREAAGLAQFAQWLQEQGMRLGWPSAFVAAHLIVSAAAARRESRGGHYRSDYPLTSSPARRTFLRRNSAGELEFLPTSGMATSS
jgi:L-aspartate oxidase